MRVLLVGGSGFTGKRVARRLEGLEVYGLARTAQASATLVASGIRAVEGDLDDPQSIDSAFRCSGADTLICVASLGFGHGPAIVAAAQEAGVERAVFVSTTGVTTQLNPASKAVRLAAEAAIECSGLQWTIIRPTMIYGGPDDRNMARLLRLVRHAPAIVVPGDGRRLQQPVHVEDLATAIVRSASCAHAVSRRFDVAGPEQLTFREIIAHAGAAVGRTPMVIPTPIRPAIGLVALYERLSRKPRLKSEQLLRLEEDKVFDIGAAREVLGFSPRSFAEGIANEAKELFGR